MSARNQNPSTPTSSESDIEARYAKKSPLQALDGNGEGGGEKKKLCVARAVGCSSSVLKFSANANNDVQLWMSI
jgi:hypothetical protein